MNVHDEPPLPPEDPALRTLPREIEPPPAVARRTLAELRRRGLVDRGRAASSRLSAGRLALAAAAALVAFGAGLWLGPRLAGAPTGPAAEDEEGRRYLLLLYEPRPIDRRELDLVREYSAWARELAREGRLVAAEKLSVEERRYPDGAAPAVSSSAQPTGFFLIRAGTAEEAEEIARSCPHLAHGGEVSLRPVDPT